jgi:CDP-diacylglycerol---serine O-phosphatidyltransferase
MTVPPPDGSRDRRIEDPTNLLVIHPAGRALLPVALRLGLSANAVSIAGLVFGVGAAACYYNWHSTTSVVVGFALSIAWLVADGLDGMIARATGSASAFGRFLDGLCDHGVFLVIYVALAWSIGTAGAWATAAVAGVAHAVQSSLYEGERARFHRRVKGQPVPATIARDSSPLVRLYDLVAGWPDRLSQGFERRLSVAADPARFGQLYGEQAAPAMKTMALLSANVRVIAIAAACLLADPRLFWWFEIVPLTMIAAIAMARHRRAEQALLSPSFHTERDLIASISTIKEHRHS